MKETTTKERNKVTKGKRIEERRKKQRKKDRIKQRHKE